MPATTINIPVNVPASYRLDELKKQLTEYAEKLVALSKGVAVGKHHYHHENLCGLLKTHGAEEDMVEEYLQDKYHL